MVALAARRAGGELGRETGGEQQLQAEGERAPALARWLAAARALVEQRERAAQQVEHARMGLGGLEQAPDSVARARGRVERARVGAQARVGVDRVRAGHRQELAAAFVQLEPQAEEGLEPPAEAARRAAHALGDRADVAAIERVQAQDAIGLAVADRAQHDRLGLDGSSGHRNMVIDRSDVSWKRRIAGATRAASPAAARAYAPPRPPKPRQRSRSSWT